MNNCNKCGAPLDAYDYVCDFCGSVIFDRIKSSNPDNQYTFEESCGIVENNLNTVHQLFVPNAGDAILKTVRTVAIIITLGFVGLIWKTSKKKFVKESYNKLKEIITRNIAFLKQNAENSKDLIGKILILENELKKADNKINKNVLTYKATAIIVPLIIITALYIYVSRVVIQVGNELHPEKVEVFPSDTLFQGFSETDSLRKTLRIGKKPTYIVKIPDRREVFSIKIPISKIKKLELPNNYYLKPELHFMRIPNSKTISETVGSIIYNVDGKLVDFLRNGSKNIDTIEFECTDNEEIFRIKNSSRCFIIFLRKDH
jgi:hypothetical protein